MDTLNKIAVLARIGIVSIADHCGTALVRVTRPKMGMGDKVFPEKTIENAGVDLGQAVDAVYARAAELEIHG